MAYFHLKLIAPRKTFPTDASPDEAAAMDRHSAYWQKQVDDGRCVAVGPVFDPDGPWGMAIVEVGNDAQAQVIVDADPIITSGLGFRYAVSPIPSLILRA